MVKSIEDHKMLLTSKKLANIRQSLNQEDVSIRELVDSLLHDGIHILVIILIAPFLFPMSIPGSSTPFGILIILLEISVLISRPLYLPNKIAEYTISHEVIIKLFDVLEKALSYIEKISKPRGKLTNNKAVVKLNSLIMISVAFLLFLPLPVPLTDFVPAVTILVLSVSCLEEDSYLLIIGYLLAIGTYAYFMSVGYIGIEVIRLVLSYIGIHI